MERLPIEKRAAVLRCLVEGCSIATTTRLTRIAKNTIQRVLAETGEACEDYQDRHAVNLPCGNVQLDEQWSYVGCKQERLKTAKKHHEGDVWTWTALCADTKFIISWVVGGRTIDECRALCRDLAPRFAGRVQVTSDGLGAYSGLVPTIMGPVDFAQLVKKYKEVRGRLEVIGIRKVARCGNPDMNLVSTSYIERQNLTTRMSNRRLTRCTNGFSKKLDNHRAMLSLTYFCYNFTRKHQTLKCTPAQEIGLTNHQWSFEELAQMVETYQVAQDEREFEKIFRLKYELP